MTDQNAQYSSDYRRATRLVTSRRIKQEQSTIIKQTAIFGGGAVLLIVVAMAVIPMVIRLFGGPGASSITDQDVLPPQVPQLAAPVEATYSATIALNGFTTAKAKVVILKNGEQAVEADADDSGNFTASLDLSEGENTISAFAKNDSAESEVSREYKTIFDKEQPKLEISEPVDGQTIQGKKNQQMTIKGSTEAHSKVYLNDRLVLVGSDGSFSTQHRVEVGENTLKFRVIDQAGNETTQELKVNFQE